MRIIVTNDGLKELSGSFEARPTLSNMQTINKSNLSLSKRSQSRDILFKRNQTTKSKKKGLLSSYRSMPDITLMKPNAIKVKQTALSIPDDKKHLYTSEIDTSSHQTSIVKQVPDVLLSLQSSQCSSGLPHLKSSYSLREIIPEVCFTKLNLKLRKEHELYFHHTKLDEKRLRNERIEIKKGVFDEIERNKQSTIEANNTNLIEYLTGKTTVTDSFLKNLATYEEERIIRLNKICQRIIEKKERDKLFQESIQKRFVNRRMIDQLNYQNEAQSIEGRVGCNKQLFEFHENYNKKRKDQYMDIHRQFVKRNWDKYNLDRYYSSEHPRKNKLCYHMKMAQIKE